MANGPIATSIKPGTYGQPAAGSLGGGGLTGGRLNALTGGRISGLPGRTHFMQDVPAADEPTTADAGDEYSFEIQV